jgi:transcriptional regulator with XRE-family HTH domain
MKVRRRARGWSQRELAERLERELGYPVHQTTVAKWEKPGRRRLALDDALAIASALDVPLVSMLDGTLLHPWIRVKVVPKRPALHPREVQQWLKAEKTLPWQNARAFAIALGEEKWWELASNLAAGEADRQRVIEQTTQALREDEERGLARQEKEENDDG